MELIVDNNTRIINDGVYLAVQTKSIVGDSDKSAALKTLKYENVGKERWTSVTYHGRLQDAVKSMVEKEITFCDDFKQVIECYNRIMKLIEERV